MKNRPESSTLEGWVLKALDFYKRKGGASSNEIIEYIDWQNHSRYSEDELRVVLDKLFASQTITLQSGKWSTIK